MPAICWSLKKWQRTFCIMDQLIYLSGKLKLSKRRRRKNMYKICIKVSLIKPETKWSNHEQVEDWMVTLVGGPNPCMWKNTGMICD